MIVKNISSIERYFTFDPHGLRLAAGASGNAPDNQESLALANKYVADGLMQIESAAHQTVSENVDSPAAIVITTNTMVATDVITLAGTNAAGTAFTYTFTVAADEDGNATERLAGMTRLKTEINASADLDSIGVKATDLIAVSATVYKLTVIQTAAAYPITAKVTVDSPDTTVSFLSSAAKITPTLASMGADDVITINGIASDAIAAGDIASITALIAFINEKSATTGFQAVPVTGDAASLIIQPVAGNEAAFFTLTYTDDSAGGYTLQSEIVEHYLVGGEQEDAVAQSIRKVVATGVENVIVTGLASIDAVVIQIHDADTGFDSTYDGLVTIVGGTIFLDDDGSADVTAGQVLTVIAYGKSAVAQ